HLERATDMIRRAVALRPEDGYIVDSLGWVHYQLGDYADAVRELERAVELRPEDPVINDHFGDALWRVGRRVEARFQWERVLSLKPEADQIEPIQKKLKEGLPDEPLPGGKS
ncbi:MAG: tetratricopeptide repeat protein, partial [Pseudomonadota bacterium]